jgi:hypothetical protein
VTKSAVRARLKHLEAAVRKATENAPREQTVEELTWRLLFGLGVAAVQPEGDVATNRTASPGCACHADPPRLHGPYWYWTRKVNAKTVSRVLSPEQAAEYRPWFEAEKRLRALVHELEELGLAVVEADPRSPHRALPAAKRSAPPVENP